MIFLAFDMAYMNSGDTVQVYEREPTSGRITSRKSFTSQDAYYSMSNSLVIKFKSDNIHRNHGFIIKFQSTSGMYFLHKLSIYFERI